MLRIAVRLLLCVWLASLALGCTRGGAAELLDTAKLEEKQRNTPNARKPYAKIVSDYPDSAEANEARMRLDALKAQGG